MKNYRFKVKRVSGGSYWFVSVVLLAITFVPLYFGSWVLLNTVFPSLEDPLYYSSLDSGSGFGMFLGIMHLLVFFGGSMAFIGWLLHAWVSIDLYDDRLEIDRKNQKRVIYFKDILDMANINKYGSIHADDRHRTPTVYIMLESETYEIRSQNYTFIGTSKQFNAFYHDFKNRLNIFVCGEPLDIKQEHYTLKQFFSSEYTEKRKEAQKQEEERRERIRNAYAKK